MFYKSIITLTPQFIGQEILVRGWIDTIRFQKKMIFI
jgi:aspartyl/asparaginyl-tRNA synthetase